MRGPSIDGGKAAIITDIQRCSLHDGPGVRTTVFFKGCAMRCFWCHNPETWWPEPVLGFTENRCVMCGACAAKCPDSAHIFLDGVHTVDRMLCRGCGGCAGVCTGDALEIHGREITVGSLVKELLQDKRYFDKTGGGVTFSGGEPLLQYKFCGAALAALKAEGIGTAVETAGFYPAAFLEEALPSLDLIIADIKLMDGRRHRDVTGVPNENILRNVEIMAKSGKPLIIRTPVIPGVNDNPGDIRAIAEHIRRFPSLLYYELMPFHNLGRHKYRTVGLEDKCPAISPLQDKETLDKLEREAREAGVSDVRTSGIYTT